MIARGIVADATHAAYRSRKLRLPIQSMDGPPNMRCALRKLSPMMTPDNLATDGHATSVPMMARLSA